MRTLLFTGPGGAGTTTLAAGAAVQAARAGRRTVLVSRQRPLVEGVDDVDGLTVVRVDALAAAEGIWERHAGVLAAALPHVDLPPASSVVPPPGAAELAVLAALGRASADADLVVLDAGPLEAGLALLALPAGLRWWLDVALPPRVRALGAIRTAAVRSGAARSGPLDALLAALPAVERLAATPLADPAATSVVLTAQARAGAVPALRSAATTLGLLGQRPAAVLARVLPGGGTGTWWTQRLAEQDEAVAGLAEIATVRPVAECATTPADVAGLAPLAVELPEPEPLPVPAAERLDGAWRLSLPLPFAERDQVELTRWADDLVITVGGVRRSVRLDSLLRRCAVTGGRLEEPGTAAARLEVTFAPDPRLWPADLLPAEESAS
ncbi:ArsA family ATPase [Petropleomorpha daqingensis]|uniref:Arsenite-transporting ATPase n=1 Tax=Petropleomorpha daqingensis TaxID=2026353 RepID=A0A853CIM2_9ACTN|nr:ion transporter [Petropleomorpha daqingensis]NYJ07650.1 arsenite-transporting ATPase [Petropleomorpha daqingensis]